MRSVLRRILPNRSCRFPAVFPCTLLHSFRCCQDASCTTPADVGKVQPGFMLTFPRGRGSCAVNEMTAVAFNQSGTSKSPVATVHWKPSDPNSQSSSKWAVLQVRAG